MSYKQMSIHKYLEEHDLHAIAEAFNRSLNVIVIGVDPDLFPLNRDIREIKPNYSKIEGEGLHTEIIISNEADIDRNVILGDAIADLLVKYTDCEQVVDDSIQWNVETSDSKVSVRVKGDLIDIANLDFKRAEFELDLREIHKKLGTVLSFSR